MDIFCYIVSIALCAGGLTGCFLPVIPGAPLAMAGYLLLLFTPVAADMHWPTIMILGLLTLFTIVSDYVIPIFGVKWFGGTSYGRKGSMLGTLVGLFFMPWGLILGPFIGAFIGEIYGKADMRSAFQSGVGSLVGFLCGTFFKVAVTLAITIYVLLTIF